MSIFPSWENSPILNRRWDDEVREIEDRFPVRCYTYANHGYEGGRPWSMDVAISPLGVRANREQEELGDRIQKFVEANARRWKIYYIIYWNWYRYPPNPWRKYEKYADRYTTGGGNRVTRRHFDHLHITISQGYQYRPPV
jgi:hypothetical protein